MNLTLTKIILGIADQLGRTFLYNRHCPTVGQIIKDIPYENSDPRQLFDIIVPLEKPPYPVLIYIHGGGWTVGDKSSYRRICRCYAHAGYLTFSVNYRLTPKHHYPAQLQDISAAISQIHELAPEYGGDIRRLFLAGDSAGAHLASWYAAALRKPVLFEKAGIDNSIPANHVKAILLFYGGYDLDSALKTGFFSIKSLTQAMIGDASKAFEVAEIASPLRHIYDNFPPSFICCAERDHLYSESMRLNDHLDRLRIPHETVIFRKSKYPLATHGFLNFYMLKCAKIAIRRSIEFLKVYSRRNIS